MMNAQKASNTSNTSNANMPHYFSDHLTRKLKLISSVKTTFVEAPSGYGKTTAIRDYLDDKLLHNTPVYWFTTANEAPTVSFKRLCAEIGKIDGISGHRLMKIGLPNAATVGEASDALRSIDCCQETYLVIDNFQYLQSSLSQSFLKALIEHGGLNLHIVIITQMLNRDILTVVSSLCILHITAADLRLGADDIRLYYSLSGVNISAENACKIEKYTEGWVIAVYLQLRAYKDTGSIADTTGIFVLIERIVWDALTSMQQTFLLRISLFETITLQQACALLGCSTLPEYSLNALNIPFIRYSSDEKHYEFHSILFEILKQKRKERGIEFEQECLLSAGDYCKKEGFEDRALNFYLQAEEYGRMLSIDLSVLILEYIGDTPFYDIALHIAQNCPYDIKKSHILAMLQIGWALLVSGKNKEFDFLMEELRIMLEEKGPKESPLLHGEWLLLSSWQQLPNLDEMTALVKQAAPLFVGTFSQVILPSAPWCFGDYSQLAVFHSKPGEADLEADALSQFLTIYSKITNGHGNGADVLFCAELEHYRGNLNEAEILARKAFCIAESSRQSIIQLGSALHLAEIAVEKSDSGSWQNAIDSMEIAASNPQQNNFVLRSAVDMLRALLLNELSHQRRISGWLKTGTTNGRLLPAMKNNAMFVNLCYFMHEGEFARLAGMSEAGLASISGSNVLADILMSLLAAIGHLLTGDTKHAKIFLRHAAKIGLADGFVYLFAVYDTILKNMLEPLIHEHYPEQLVRFHEIKDRFYAGYTALHKHIATDGLPGDLTAREREVALLAVSGLHNSEIAKKLIVSESTVRAHMRTIFQKLDIDRRSKLAEKLIT